MKPRSRPPLQRQDQPAFLLFFLLMGAIAALLYGHTLDVPWYLDDLRTIADNPNIQQLDRAWGEIWRPRGVVIFTFALNQALGGLNPAGFHLVNIVLHLAAAWFAFLILQRIFPRQSTLALGAALIFLIHPLQTAAVTYTVQRMSVMAGAFFLLCLWLYVRGREARQRRMLWFAAAGASGALAILSKQNAIVLPLAIFVFDRYFLPRSGPSLTEGRKMLLDLAPGLALVAAAIALVLWRDLLHPALASGLASTGGGENLTASGRVTPLRYLFTEFSVLWLYLRLLLLPVGQAFDYGYPPVATLVEPRTLVALAGLLLLAGLAWRLRRSQPRLSFATAWFFLTLAVESSVIPLDPVFEHRLYLPLFAWSVVCGDLWQRLGERWWRPLLTVLVFCSLGLLTIQRNQLWREPARLWEDNLKHAPWNYRVVLGAAIEAARSGNSPRAREIVQRYLPPLLAKPELLRNPKFLHEAGLACRGAGEESIGEAYLRRALEIKPDFAIAWYNLGILLHDRGDLVAADEALEKSWRHQPGSMETVFARAVTKFKLGDRGAATAALPTLNRLAPQYAQELRMLLDGR